MTNNALVSLAAGLILCGCTATHDRPMNRGERTIVSDQVMAMVDESGGKLDIRDKENVRCERYRLVGTHMVTRVCYTKEEYKELAKKNKDEYYGRFGRLKCLDQSSAACDLGIEEPTFGGN